MKIKERFSRLITLNTILIIAIVTIIVSLVVTAYSYNTTKKQASNLAHVAASLIDGETMRNCALNGKTNDAYYDECDQLLKIKENVADCVYMYGFVPTDDCGVYVFDIYTKEQIAAGVGSDPDEDLGYKETWSNINGAYDIYKTGKDIDKAEISLFFSNDYGNLISCYAPVYNDAGELMMIIGVDYEFIDFISMILIIIGLILISIAFFVWLLSRRELKQVDQAIVQPIALIEGKTREFAQSKHEGNFEQYLLPEIQNPVGELDFLSVSINKMIKDIETYIQNLETVTAEKERVATELSLSASIQADALPNIFPAFPDIPELDLYATMDPAKEVGGDFYDFFLIDSDHVSFVIADVSGKGIPAALFMMIGKALIKNQAAVGKKASEILGTVNKQLCENNNESMFITAWMGILDIRTGIMDTANAGHEYMAIKRANGEFELLKDKHGMALGVFEMSKYRSLEITINPGDSFFVYTDGVPEATNASNELFGTERMLETLNQNSECDCICRLNDMKKAVASFVKEAPQFDDLTMLTVNYLKYKTEE